MPSGVSSRMSCRPTLVIDDLRIGDGLDTPSPRRARPGPLFPAPVKMDPPVSSIRQKRCTTSVRDSSKPYAHRGRARLSNSKSPNGNIKLVSPGARRQSQSWVPSSPTRESGPLLAQKQQKVGCGDMDSSLQSPARFRKVPPEGSDVADSHLPVARTASAAMSCHGHHMITRTASAEMASGFVLLAL